MPAPRGNKYALGNKGGAPRTVSPEPEAMEALGKEMLEWIEENNPIHVKQWYSLHKGFSREQWQAMILCKEFLVYYHRALDKVGMHYINGNINPSIAHRFMRHYFKEVKDEENEEVVFKANTAAQAIQSYTQEDSDKLAQVLKAINQRQAEVPSSSKSTLSEAETNNSTEIKS